MVQPLNNAQIEESVTPGGLVAHWERALVGQLARETHAAGEQFDHWPHVAVLNCVLGDKGWVNVDKLFATHVLVDVYVDTSPRKP